MPPTPKATPRLREGRLLSQGFSPADYPTKPLVSYRIYRQLSVWNPPPLVIRAFGAHRQKQHFPGLVCRELRFLTCSQGQGEVCPARRDHINAD